MTETRPDPFTEVGRDSAVIGQDAGLQAKTVFQELQRKTTLIDSLHGTIKTRNAASETGGHSRPDKKSSFLRLYPGEQGQSDFTNMNELGITIAGVPFAFDYHFVSHSQIGNTRQSHIRKLESLSRVAERTRETGMAPQYIARTIFRRQPMN